MNNLEGDPTGPTGQTPSSRRAGDSDAGTGSGDVEVRITSLLNRVAEGVPVQSDPDAITSLDSAMVVRLADRPSRTRRRLALAGVAAAALMLVAGVAVMMQTDRSEPVTAAAPPGPDDVYPVLDYLPDSVTEPPVALTVTYEASGPPNMVAVLGRTLEDGTVTDMVRVEVGWSDLEIEDPHEGEMRDIAGRRANVLTTNDEATGHALLTVTLDGDPLIHISGGSNVIEVLEALGPDGLASGLDDRQRPTLTVADPPGDIDVLVAPTPVDYRPMRHVRAGESVLVATSQGPALDSVAWYDAARPVDVAGSPGWAAATGRGHVVAWKAANGVTISAEFTGADQAEALAIAQGVRLVDWATWEKTYPIEDPSTSAGSDDPEQGATTTLPEGHTALPDGSIVLPDGSVVPPDDAPPTTAVVDPDPAVHAEGRILDEHPLLGQPMPEIAGLDTYHHYTRAWTVVTTVGSWCVPCQASLAELGAFAGEHITPADLRTLAVLVEDEGNSGIDFLADVLPALSDDPAHTDQAELAAQGLDLTFPTTYLIDPEGTVVSVFAGPVPAAALEAELDAQQEAAGHPELTWVQDGYCSYPDRTTGKTTC